MHHYFVNAMIVYILCNQIIGLNSKSSILWKLNDKSGKIVSYSDSHQHVSVRTEVPYSLLEVLSCARIYVLLCVHETRATSSPIRYFLIKNVY